MIEQRNHGEGFLASLPADFRLAVEASARNIVLKIEPATVDRLERLAAIASSEGDHALTDHAATNAFALAAELRRRAALLRN